MPLSKQCNIQNKCIFRILEQAVNRLEVETKRFCPVLVLLEILCLFSASHTYLRPGLLFYIEIFDLNHMYRLPLDYLFYAFLGQLKYHPKKIDFKLTSLNDQLNR